MKPQPDLATMADMQSLDLLRQVRHLQCETHQVAGETLATVQPLSALLQLLDRPEDQRQELGEQLSETLRLMSGQLQQIIIQGNQRAEVNSRTQEAIAQLSQAQQASRKQQESLFLQIAKRLEYLEAELLAEA